jgi:HEAT repeat protein
MAARFEEGPQPATDDPGSRGAPDGPARRREAVRAGHGGDLTGALAAAGDSDPSVRVAALGALARLGRFDGPALSTALGDPDPTVRRRACEAAGRLAGDPGDGLGAADAVGLLEAVLEDPDPLVAEAAAWALGEQGALAGVEPVVIGALAAMAGGHPDALCREAAVAALGALGDPAGLEAVLAALGDKPAVRRRAAVALAAFEDPRADEGLRQCLGDRDWQVRQVAEDLLAEG